MLQIPKVLQASLVLLQLHYCYEIGTETTLDSIKDYDGNLHAGDNLETASSYKYQGMLDVNGDGVFEAIFTNKVSKRWVTAKVDSTTVK